MNVWSLQLPHCKTYLCVSDIPGRRPLHPQRSHEAAPQPVPGELLRGVLQATGDRVWGGAGGGERGRGLAWPPSCPESSPAHTFSPALTSIPSLCPKHNTWHSVVHDMQLSPALCSIWFCIWTPRVRMPNLRLPFSSRLTIDLILRPSSLPPPILWCPLQSSDLKRPPPPSPPESRHRLTTSFWNIPNDLTGSSLLHSGMDQLLK